MGRNADIVTIFEKVNDMSANSTRLIYTGLSTEIAEYFLNDIN